MNNVRDAGFSRKRGGNAGSGPPLLDPALSAISSSPGSSSFKRPDFLTSSLSEIEPS